MPIQLRTYTLHPGKMHEFIQLFREQIAPLREKVGFTVFAAWTVAETNQFIWLMAYDGLEDWAVLDRRYFDAPERLTMSPNPSVLIAKSEVVFVETLDF